MDIKERAICSSSSWGVNEQIVWLNRKMAQAALIFLTRQSVLFLLKKVVLKPTLVGECPLYSGTSAVSSGSKKNWALPSITGSFPSSFCLFKKRFHTATYSHIIGSQNEKVNATAMKPETQVRSSIARYIFRFHAKCITYNSECFCPAYKTLFPIDYYEKWSVGLRKADLKLFFVLCPHFVDPSAHFFYPMIVHPKAVACPNY